MQDGKGRGGDGLVCLNQKCKHCSAVDNGAMNLTSAFEIRFRIANSCMRWRGIFRGLSQDRGRTDFSRKLCAFLFYKDLSIEPSFCRIHLAGQHLLIF
jgi:hypothetical protein